MISWDQPLPVSPDLTMLYQRRFILGGHPAEIGFKEEAGRRKAGEWKVSKVPSRPSLSKQSSQSQAKLISFTAPVFYFWSMSLTMGAKQHCIKPWSPLGNLSESSQDSESETTSPSTSAPPTTFQPPPCICSWPRTGSGCCPTLSNLSDTVAYFVASWGVRASRDHKPGGVWGKGLQPTGKKDRRPLVPPLSAPGSRGVPCPQRPRLHPSRVLWGGRGAPWRTTEGTVRTSR